MGTAALVITLILQIILYRLLNLEITKQMWVFAGLGVAFGGITLLLDNELFIKIRPAVVSSFIIVVVLVLEFVAKKNPLKMLMGQFMSMADRAWRGITLIFVVCLAANATLNVLIAFNLSNDFWVGYRMVSAFAAPFTIFLFSYVYIKLTKQSVTLHDPSSVKTDETT